MLAKLEAVLQHPGSKTDLAQVLCANGRMELTTAKPMISRILSKKVIPNGEDALAIQEFIATYRPNKA